MQQFSAVVIDVVPTLALDEYSQVIKSATYSNAVIQVYSPDTGSAILQANSVDDPDIAGTPDSTSWYDVGASVPLPEPVTFGPWNVSAILPICAKYLRVKWTGTIGDQVIAVLTLQG